MRSARARRALSLTPLVDVIFLLLLFFMLSSTFTRFGEVEMSVGAAGVVSAEPRDLAFLRLAAEALSLNGVSVELDALVSRLEGLGVPTLVVSVDASANAQRLTDLLVVLKDASDVDVVLLGQQ